MLHNTRAVTTLQRRYSIELTNANVTPDCTKRNDSVELRNSSRCDIIMKSIYWPSFMRPPPSSTSLSRIKYNLLLLSCISKSDKIASPTHRCHLALECDRREEIMSRSTSFDCNATIYHPFHTNTTTTHHLSRSYHIIMLINIIIITICHCTAYADRRERSEHRTRIRNLSQLNW